MPKVYKNPLKDVGEIQRRLAAQAKMPKLGDLVKWGTDSIEISPQDLEAALKRRGIADWMPRQIQDRKAVRKAIIRVKDEMAKGGVGKLLARRVWDRPEETRYALVDETVDLTREDLDFSTRNQVVFDKNNTTISFTKGEIPEIVDLFNHYRNIYTDVEVRKTIENIIIRHGAVSMADHSGMWFVPAMFSNVTDAIRGLMNDDLDGKYGTAWCRTFAILDDKATGDSLGRVVQADIMAELETAQKNLEVILQTPNPSSFQVQQVVDRYNVADMKAQMYMQMLNISMEEVNEIVTAGKGALSELMVIKTDEVEEPDAAGDQV